MVGLVMRFNHEQPALEGLELKVLRESSMVLTWGLVRPLSSFSGALCKYRFWGNEPVC